MFVLFGLKSFLKGFLLGSLIWSNSFIEPFGKEWVGGAGLIENEFTMVWENSSHWVGPCLAGLSVCSLTFQEMEALKNFPQNLVVPKLNFVSFLQRPELMAFTLDKEQIIATSPRWGEVVFINNDRLYAEGSDPLAYRGIQRPIKQLLAALFYQSGHPLELSYSISTKISEFWQARQFINHLGQAGFPELSLNYFIGDSVVILSNDHSSMKNLTPWVVNSLRCESISQKGEIINFGNTYWVHVSTIESQIVGQLKGQIYYRCSGEQTAFFKSDIAFNFLFLNLDNEHKKFELDISKSQVQSYNREKVN